MLTQPTRTIYMLLLIALPASLPWIVAWALGATGLTTWNKAGLSVVSAIILGTLLIDIAHKLAIRKICQARGWEILKITLHKNSFGVTYRHDGEKKYARWPADFQTPP